MAYTPELTQEHSAALRRIAWTLKMPMTRAMGQIFDYLGTKLDKDKICQACRDKTNCSSCSFNR